MGIVLKISQQTAWQLLSKSATTLSSVIIISLISRNLGEDGTGVFSLSLTVLGFLYVAIDLGLNGFLLAEKDSDTYKTWPKLLGFRLILSLALTFLAAAATLFYPNLPKPITYSLLLSLVGLLPLGVYLTNLLIFQSELRYDLASFPQLVQAVLSLALVYLGVLLHLPIWFLVLGVSLGAVASSLTSLLFVKKLVKFSLSLDKNFISQALVKGWPLAVSLVLNTIYFRADSIIIAFFRPVAEVGIYNLAYQVFQTILVLPTFIMNGFYPLLLKSHKLAPEEFNTMVSVGISILLSLSALAVFGTVLFSNLFIQLLSGGTGFTGSPQVLRILAFGFPAFFLSSLLMWLMVVFRQYQQLIFIYACGFVFGIILDWLFIPKLGYLPAAFITVVSEYLILALQIVILYPKFIKKR